MRKIYDYSTGYHLNYYGNMSDDGIGTRFLRPRLALVSEHHAYYTVGRNLLSSGISDNSL